MIYATQKGGIYARDLRMKKDAWKLPYEPKFGLILKMVLDPDENGTWIVSGTSRGKLSLWDVRFQLQVI